MKLLKTISLVPDDVQSWFSDLTESHMLDVVGLICVVVFMVVFMLHLSQIRRKRNDEMMKEDLETLDARSKT